MSYKIVVDSSADLLSMEGVELESAPLKILAGDREFVDDASLDVEEMVSYMKSYTGTSGTACPSAGEWMAAFGDAEEVYCITITSNLSGSYNAARVAAEEYEAAYPGRQVRVLDSLSTGPEMVLMVEKIMELRRAGLDIDTVARQVRDYALKVELAFALGSLNNLARNGRVNPAVAKVAGVLGIRVVGTADDGRLAPQHKCRGEKRSIQAMVELMVTRGYQGGKVGISHCQNLPGAQALAELVRTKWPQARIGIWPARGLVSYYAEANGLLMAFET